MKDEEKSPKAAPEYKPEHFNADGELIDEKMIKLAAKEREEMLGTPVDGFAPAEPPPSQPAAPTELPAPLSNEPAPEPKPEKKP